MRHPVIKVIGYVLIGLVVAGLGVHQTGDMVPIARIAALIAMGKIEARGDPYELQTCTIRRADSKAANLLAEPSAM